MGQIVCAQAGSHRGLSQLHTNSEEVHILVWQRKGMTERKQLNSHKRVVYY